MLNSPEATKMKISKRSLQFSLWFLAFVILSYQTYDGTEELEVPTLHLNFLQLTLHPKLQIDISSLKGKVLKGYLGWLPKNYNSSTYTRCSEDSPTHTICFKYNKGMKLSITEENLVSDSVSCYRVQWKNHMSGAMDCYNLGEQFWYGGDITISQRWPVQHQSYAWYPKVTGDPLHHLSGNIQENTWFSSGGFLIHVEHYVPLFLSFNMSGNNKLCFSTSKKHPYQSLKAHDQELTYSLCAANSVKEAKQYATHRWQPKPNSIPKEELFQFPIWSTWARHKQYINESTVIDFAYKIKEADMAASQLEIDDNWETCYGDLEFNLARFRNPKKMTRKALKLGMPTTLWVHPFCNRDCKCFSIGEERGFWVKDRDGNPARVKWWNGDESVLLDLTNKQATEWFKRKLKRLQNVYGIESFKFDAGEILWLDKEFVLEGKATLQPYIYSREYSRLAAEFGGRVEVRVGFETQDLPVFVRMFDKFSNWNHANGLRTLIPHALQLSMLGYNFMLPDMIGGNNYTPNNGSLPNPELYIRWLQATLFLPAIQFSIAPFDYDEKVTETCKRLLELRKNYVNDLLKAAIDTTQTGDPMIRPLWWIAPSDVDALSTDSQFLVGDRIMVAPVLWEGATKRNIYFPEGRWADAQRNVVYEGPKWLHNYEAPLNFLPFFIRQLSHSKNQNSIR